MAEKTEKPTEKRRRESAQKGQSFKVKDVNTTVVLISGIAYLGYGMSFEPFIAFYNNVILNGESLSYQGYLISLAIGINATDGNGLFYCRYLLDIASNANGARH